VGQESSKDRKRREKAEKKAWQRLQQHPPPGSLAQPPPADPSEKKEKPAWRQNLPGTVIASVLSFIAGLGTGYWGFYLGSKNVEYGAQLSAQSAAKAEAEKRAAAGLAADPEIYANLTRMKCQIENHEPHTLLNAKIFVHQRVAFPPQVRAGVEIRSGVFEGGEPLTAEFFGLQPGLSREVVFESDFGAEAACRRVESLSNCQPPSHCIVVVTCEVEFKREGDPQTYYRYDEAIQNPPNCSIRPVSDYRLQRRVGDKVVDEKWTDPEVEQAYYGYLDMIPASSKFGKRILESRHHDQTLHRRE
jgi:hypothetical protein